MTPRVDAVVLHWKRPANIAPILERLREQTEPCRVVLVDCHPAEEFALDPATIALAHRYVRDTVDLGPFSRFVPALGHESEYVYYHDDDMLPGRRAVERLVYWYRHLRCGRPVGIMGHLGRRLPGGAYNMDPVPRGPAAVRVDVVLRAYLLRTCDLVYLHRLAARLRLPGYGEFLRHDDLALAFGLSRYGRTAHFLAPIEDDPATFVNEQELDDTHAFWRRPGHVATRTAFLDWARATGWRPAEDR